MTSCNAEKNPFHNSVRVRTLDMKKVIRNKIKNSSTNKNATLSAATVLPSTSTTVEIHPVVYPSFSLGPPLPLGSPPKDVDNQIDSPTDKPLVTYLYPTPPVPNDDDQAKVHIENVSEGSSPDVIFIGSSSPVKETLETINKCPATNMPFETHSYHPLPTPIDSSSGIEGNPPKKCKHCDNTQLRLQQSMEKMHQMLQSMHERKGNMDKLDCISALLYCILFFLHEPNNEEQQEQA